MDGEINVKGVTFSEGVPVVIELTDGRKMAGIAHKPIGIDKYRPFFSKKKYPLALAIMHPDHSGVLDDFMNGGLLFSEDEIHQIKTI